MDAAGGTAAANQAIAKNLAAVYGWSSGAQWDALVKLWEKESSWNNRAVNKSSGATGIPQALPATKMPAAAQAPTYNASSQIQWGLQYIKSRYGDPIHAWAHEQSAGWY
jgi:SLT domain-containing protein